MKYLILQFVACEGTVQVAFSAFDEDEYADEADYVATKIADANKYDTHDEALRICKKLISEYDILALPVGLVNSCLYIYGITDQPNPEEFEQRITRILKISPFLGNSGIKDFHFKTYEEFDFVRESVERYKKEFGLI